ncbi:MAG TPA: hypothetical protein VI316_10410 [Candidatus Dormibacteraeota bacterium]
MGAAAPGTPADAGREALGRAAGVGDRRLPLLRLLFFAMGRAEG